MTEIMKKVLTDKKARNAKKLKLAGDVFSPWTVA